MQLPSALSWLIDSATALPSADRLLAELGRHLVADGVPLAGGALTFAVPDPIIARRTWLWRADTGGVTEAFGFAGGMADGAEAEAGRNWLRALAPGVMHEDVAGSGSHALVLGWIGPRAFTAAETEQLRQAARFAAPPLAALAERATLQAALEAYLGRRSAARVMGAPLRRDVGETIRAALLFADLRGFTALSEAEAAADVIAALDAWFDRIALAVQAFGGEVLKFIGDGLLAIFPVSGDSSRGACEAALRAVTAARAGMVHLDATRKTQGLAPLPFGVAVHLGEIYWGNIGAADRLDFTAIGPAVNLVSRLEGLCRPLERTVLISGAVAAETEMPLVSLGAHALRGIAAPCAVFTLPELQPPA
jgi:class 3 adenylate cyclase